MRIRKQDMATRRIGRVKVLKHEWKEGNTVVPLRLLLLDKDLQARAKVNTEAVEEYAERFAEGGSEESLPPIEVVFDPTQVNANSDDEGKAWVTDGWHRVMAAGKAGLLTLPAFASFGDKALAMHHAAKANMMHGVRRTNADKRMALALIRRAHPEATVAEWADTIGVTRQFIYSTLEKEAAMTKAIEGMVCDSAEEASEIDEDVTPTLEQRMKEATDTVHMVLDKIIEARKFIDGARDAEENGLPEQEWIAFLNVQAILSDLDNAKNALWTSKPYSICPVCGGAGCAMCRGKGWVSAQQYKLIPKAQREGVAE